MKNFLNQKKKNMKIKIKDKNFSIDITAEKKEVVAVNSEEKIEKYMIIEPEGDKEIYHSSLDNKIKLARKILEKVE